MEVETKYHRPWPWSLYARIHTNAAYICKTTEKNFFEKGLNYANSLTGGYYILTELISRYTYDISSCIEKRPVRRKETLIRALLCFLV